ncbi:hypothetical protein LJC18_00150 [Lachnospiraceae bacterium OttesenSCG-928-E19]|nr:hypothetical protein [Lachnospiraceae bacterium OttesenSCG-928-E19]
MRKIQRYNLKKIIPMAMLAVGALFTSCDEDPVELPEKKFNTTVSYDVGQDYSQFAQLNSLLRDKDGNKPDTLFLMNTNANALPDGYNLNNDMYHFKDAKQRGNAQGTVVMASPNSHEIKNVTELSDENLAFLRDQLKQKVQDNRLSETEKRILELTEKEMALRAEYPQIVHNAKFVDNDISSYLNMLFKLEEGPARNPQNMRDSTERFVWVVDQARIENGNPLPMNNTSMTTLDDKSKEFIQVYDEKASLLATQKVAKR